MELNADLCVKRKRKSNNVIDIFNSMNNYLLQGMPCDEVQSIITKKMKYY